MISRSARRTPDSDLVTMADFGGSRTAEFVRKVIGRRVSIDGLRAHGSELHARSVHFCHPYVSPSPSDHLPVFTSACLTRHPARSRISGPPNSSPTVCLQNPRDEQCRTRANPTSRSDSRYTSTTDFTGRGWLVIIIAPFSLKLTPRAFSRRSLTHTTALNLRGRRGTRRGSLGAAFVPGVPPARLLKPAPNEFNADRMGERILLIRYRSLPS